MAGLLDDSTMRQYRQLPFFSNLARIGQGLLAASAGGQPPMRALAAGLAQSAGANPMQMLEMRDYLGKRQRENDRAGKHAELGGAETQRRRLIGGLKGRGLRHMRAAAMSWACSVNVKALIRACFGGCSKGSHARHREAAREGQGKVGRWSTNRFSSWTPSAGGGWRSTVSNG